MKKAAPFLCLIFNVFTLAKAQSVLDPATIMDKMQWFADAKLGIFIHSGIYSVNGIDESWSFHNKKISYPDYMKQLKGFTLKKYDPEQCADLIKQSGARYAVITTNHHDGVTMYDSKVVPTKHPQNNPCKAGYYSPIF